MLRAGNGDFAMPQDAISPRSVAGPDCIGSLAAVAPKP
jgi:hypothetical protein